MREKIAIIGCKGKKKQIENIFKSHNYNLTNKYGQKLGFSDNYNTLYLSHPILNFISAEFNQPKLRELLKRKKYQIISLENYDEVFSNIKFKNKFYISGNKECPKKILDYLLVFTYGDNNIKPFNKIICNENDKYYFIEENCIIKTSDVKFLENNNYTEIIIQ